MIPNYAAFMSGTHQDAIKKILAIDVGATTIKFCHVDEDGALLESVRRRPTPSPCPPERLVEILSARIARCECPLVGVGFPGEVSHGRVIDPGNLARSGGVTGELDRRVHDEWLEFSLEEELGNGTGRDVRVRNDAELAALGICSDSGTELVVTLGTGLGVALEVDGVMQRVRDVGALDFTPGRTYDDHFGEASRARDESAWRDSLVEAVSGLVEEIGATTVYLAGGNARRLSPRLFGDLKVPVFIRGNESALTGVAKLFYD
jgi:polyphosphate glucokinase